MELLVKYIIVFILIFGFACTPPRARRFSSHKTQNTRITKAKQERFNNRRKIKADKYPSVEKKSTIAELRFKDTTFIDLNNVENSKYKLKQTNMPDDKPKARIVRDNHFRNKPHSDLGIIDDYKNAVELLNNDKFSEACPIIDNIIEKLSDLDTLKYDALFYRSECLIQDGKLQESIRILLSLINNKLSTPSVLEKSLVRIGHIYCLENNKQTAEMYFDRLRNEFPHSPYIRLANCMVVNK